MVLRNRILSYEKHRVAYLVYEILAMIVAKFLGSNDPMEICFHQLLNEIDLLKQFERRRLEYVEDGYDVLVAEVAEELDFAKGAETEHGMVERSDALDGDLPLRGYVDG